MNVSLTFPFEAGRSALLHGVSLDGAGSDGPGADDEDEGGAGVEDGPGRGGSSAVSSGWTSVSTPSTALATAI